MAIINAFYTYLTNRSSVDLLPIPMRDIVSDSYVPREMHTIASDLFKLAFSDDLEHSQRLINVVRLSLQKGPLSRFLHNTVDGGVDIDDIERFYQNRNRPITDAGTTLAFSGRLRSNYYRLVRINLAMDGDDLLVLNESGSPYTAEITLTDNLATVVFPLDSCSMTIPRSEIPGGVNWSSIPINMLQSLETNKFVIAGLLERYIAAVPTTLDKLVVEKLVASAKAEVSFYALGAISILVASHVAKLAGEEFL